MTGPARERETSRGRLRLFDLAEVRTLQSYPPEECAAVRAQMRPRGAWIPIGGDEDSIHLQWQRQDGPSDHAGERRRA